MALFTTVFWHSEIEELKYDSPADPPYQPDLASLDQLLLPKWIKSLSGERVSLDEEIIADRDIGLTILKIMGSVKKIINFNVLVNF